MFLKSRIIFKDKIKVFNKSLISFLSLVNVKINVYTTNGMILHQNQTQKVNFLPKKLTQVSQKWFFHEVWAVWQHCDLKVIFWNQI